MVYDTTDNELNIYDGTRWKSQVVEKTQAVDAASDPAVSGSTGIVFYSASLAAGTIYLPSAVEGKKIILIRVANAGTSANTAGTGGALVNGGASVALSTVLYEESSLYCDGTNWFLTG